MPVREADALVECVRAKGEAVAGDDGVDPSGLQPGFDIETEFDRASGAIGDADDEAQRVPATFRGFVEDGANFADKLRENGSVDLAIAEEPGIAESVQLHAIQVVASAGLAQDSEIVAADLRLGVVVEQPLAVCFAIRSRAQSLRLRFDFCPHLHERW